MSTDTNDLPGETWKPVAADGFGRFYEVSDLGRVRSTGKHKRGGWSKSPRILKQFNVRGYRVLELSAGQGAARNWQVHILVLEAFVGPRPEGHQTRHLNGDPSDNRLCNLRWGTPAENVADCFRHGTRIRKLSEAQAQEIRASTERTKDLAAKFGISRDYVREIRRGRKRRKK